MLWCTEAALESSPAYGLGKARLSACRRVFMSWKWNDVRFSPFFWRKSLCSFFPLNGNCVSVFVKLCVQHWQNLYMYVYIYIHVGRVWAKVERVPVASRFREGIWQIESSLLKTKRNIGRSPVLEHPFSSALPLKLLLVISRKGHAHPEVTHIFIFSFCWILNSLI